MILDVGIAETANVRCPALDVQFSVAGSRVAVRSAVSSAEGATSTIAWGNAPGTFVEIKQTALKARLKGHAATRRFAQ
jgi:hypothetical protein